MAQEEGSSPLARNDSEEIDRIMKEIEDLEKNMDSETDAVQQKAEAEASEAEKLAKGTDHDAGQQGEATTISDDTNQELAGIMAEQPSNVIPMNRNTDMQTESLAETDAVPASDEPLMKAPSNVGAADGALSLKIGGCAEVALEFERAGMAVKLSCTDQGLTITTDSGAEFRVPFKQAA